MKKLTLVLALLVSFGLVGAFAVEVAPVVDFSASADATFGIDLNSDMTTGFENSAEADLTVTWVDTAEETAEGDSVYGWIMIEDILVSAAIDENSEPADYADISTGVPADDEAAYDNSQVWDASIGDITARIYMKPAYIEIASAPGFDFDNATQIRVDNTEDADPVDSLGSNDIIATNGGITVGFEGLAGMMDLAFKVGSAATYDKDYDQVTGSIGTAANTDNFYAMGVDLTVTPMDMLSVGLGMVFTNDDTSESKMGFTVNPVLTMDVMSGLTFAVPADIAVNRADLGLGSGNAKADAIRFDVAPELTLALTDGGSSLMAKVFLAGNTDAVVPGNLFMDAKIGFDEVETDGFVPGLASHLYFYLFDVLDTLDAGNDMGYGLDFGLSYNANGIKPYLDAQYYLTATGDDPQYTIINEDGLGSEFLKLSAGVELSGMIDNTTFDINYSSNNLTNDTDPVSGETDAGRISFTATVTF